MHTTQTTRTESLEHRPPSAPEPRGHSWFPRRVLFFAALGLLVLAASIIGTGWMLRSHASDGNSTTVAPPEDGKVIGFGFVDVEGGVAALKPEQGGQVLRIPVKENQFVKKDTILLELDSRLAQAKVDEAKGDLEAAEAKLRGAEELPKTQEEEIAGQNDVIDAAEKGVEAAKQIAAQAKRLKGVAPGVTEESYQAALQKVGQAEALVRAEKAKLRGLKLRKQQTQMLISRARGEVAAKQAQLREATLVRDQFVMKAPADGIILRISTSVGELIGPTRPEPVMSFGPGRPEDRIIRAEIEQESGAKVKPGLPAVVKDYSNAPGRWEGEVKSVSDWYAHRRSLLLEPRQFNDIRTLECIVKLKPGQPTLKIGQRMTVILGK